MPIETSGVRRGAGGRPRAAVIGSGFGGLACAARLAAQGFETTVLERHDKPGGRAYVFEDQGFKFDAGPTVVTAPPCLDELFALSARATKHYVDLMPVAPMYRLLWEDGETFDYHADEEALLAEIERIAPGDVAGYKRFYRYAREVYEAGYEELCHVPFLKFWDMIKVAPDLVRLKAHVPVYKTVSRFFESDKLRQAFSFNSLLIGGNPMRASSIYTLIHPLEREWGVSFPRGGMHALVRALVKLIEDLGGQVRTNAAVDRIETESGKVTGVRLADGTRIAADLVVSNADVVHTYDKLLRDEPLAAARTKKLKRSRHSMSLFLIYFGTRRFYPGLVQHNVFFGPRYAGLLKDIFDNGVVADDFSLYLHHSSQADRSLAPEGCEAYYVLSPVPHLGHGNYDWEKDGEKYADQILSYLEAHGMPGLRQEIVTKRIFTPKDFEGRLGAHLGSAFSLEPTLTQSAYFRVHNRDPDIGGLYMVGAGTHPGAGIPGVVGSAKATAGVVAEDYAAWLRAFQGRVAPAAYAETPV